MAINATPLWMEGLATHASQQYRLFLQALANFKPGIVSSGDFLVTTNNNMTVNVARGLGVVDGTEDANQGSYFVNNDATTIVSVDAAHATLPRYDMVVIRLRDDFYATGPTEGVDLFVVKGTPASSPAEPTIPENCFVLARLTITAADAVIASGDITDRRLTTTNQGRLSLIGGFRVVTSATRPTTNLQPYNDMIIESDTGRLLWYDGSVWRMLSGAFAGTPIASFALNTSLTATGCAITLTPGSWIITAKCELAYTGGSGGAGATLAIYNNTAALTLDKAEWFSSAVGPWRVPASCNVSLTLTANATIQARALASVATLATADQVKMTAIAASVIS